ncbi:hypothetical protein GYMLUDRAFT_90523 [Collybiopsis luxurians FD-317 M1]|nr:hypothetical protein GYMLUDRAFT_90523 [Collybiopsis luxurians FD-317 M1]
MTLHSDGQYAPFAKEMRDSIVSLNQHANLRRKQRSFKSIPAAMCLSILAVALFTWRSSSIRSRSVFNLDSHSPAPSSSSFFYNISSAAGSLCPGVGFDTPSYSGYVGLEGDTKSSPRRSFSWYFGAESHDPNAPVILTMGGGPGTSGLTNALFGESPCKISSKGLVANPHGWTERYNLIVLDHPVGAGLSYAIGHPQVNNSRDAALDVYDFLQKFYILFPHLAGNKLIIAGGSYGGIYVPNIATVIQEGNRAVDSGSGKKRIHLESLMIHNPMTDPYSHFRWLLHQVCVNHDVFGAQACKEGYAVLPRCLEALDYVLESSVPSTPEKRYEAMQVCVRLSDGYKGNISLEDIRLRCKVDDIYNCYPEFTWIKEFFNRPEVKDTLGVPDYVNFETLNRNVTKAFRFYGDATFRHHRLYEPLLADGIRVLHYVGAQDANCAWPGVLSFLKLIRSPYQEEFIRSEEIPWPHSLDTPSRMTGDGGGGGVGVGAGNGDGSGGYVRKVGEGAGDMTFVLIEGAGHFSVHDQTAVVKSIVEHWIENEPFV